MVFVMGMVVNYVDVLDKLCLFLIVNESLVVVGQIWQQLWWVFDNLDFVDMILLFSLGVFFYCMFWLDFWIQNYNDDVNGQYLLLMLFILDQYVCLKMCVVWVVMWFIFKVGQSLNVCNYMLCNFWLEYLDDGSVWFIVLDVIEQCVWIVNEECIFIVFFVMGEYLWWCLVIKQIGDYGGILIGFQWEFWFLWLYDGLELVLFLEFYLVVKGLGLVGDEEIFVVFCISYNIGMGEYFMMVQGLIGYLLNEQFLYCQFGLYLSGWLVVFFWGVFMFFWFVGSGCCVVFVFKVLIVFEVGYVGFFLFYVLLQQYLYLMVIGGFMLFCLDSYWYDFVLVVYSVFLMFGSYNSVWVSEVVVFSIIFNVMLLDGFWFDLYNRLSFGGQFELYFWWFSFFGFVLLYGMFDGNNFLSSVGYGIWENVGGGFIVLLLILFQCQLLGWFLGELDGCFQILGFQNGFENIGIIEGEDYVVFQNIY